MTLGEQKWGLGDNQYGGWANTGFGFSFKGVSTELRRVLSFLSGELVSWSFYRLAVAFFLFHERWWQAGFMGSWGVDVRLYMRVKGNQPVMQKWKGDGTCRHGSMQVGMWMEGLVSCKREEVWPIMQVAVGRDVGDEWRVWVGYEGTSRQGIKVGMWMEGLVSCKREEVWPVMQVAVGDEWRVWVV